MVLALAAQAFSHSVVPQGSWNKRIARRLVIEATASSPLARTRGRRSATFRPPSTTSLGTVPARDAGRHLMLISLAADHRPIVFERA
jgi:hypothetical protein